MAKAPDDHASVRETLKRDFGLDYEARAEDRIKQAGIVAAWMAAGKRVEAEDPTEATQIASGLP